MKIPLAGFVIALSIFCSSAAYAASCVIITYYSDASLSRTVGVWSSCPGQKGLQGQSSRFSERETVQLEDPRPGPGGLPCEFLAEGCKPLPTRR